MITEEGARLAGHWNRIGATELDRYLVQSVEHPSCNPQSILMRAFLVDRLFPRIGAPIIEAELYYSACACFALTAQREGRFGPLYRSVMRGEDERLPPFLRKDFRNPFVRYFDPSRLYREIAVCCTVGFDEFSSPFESHWREFLESGIPRKCKLVELGCGSANDYRAWCSRGLARWVDYTGVDVSETNVRNALRRYPDVNFIVDDICSMDAADQEFEVSLAFDVFEHLSEASLPIALSETLRVARDECWISFFNLTDIPYHEFRQAGDYHWNLLSMSQVAEAVQSAGFDAEFHSVAGILESRFPGYHHYNREAHILAATRRC